MELAAAVAIDAVPRRPRRLGSAVAAQTPGEAEAHRPACFVLAAAARDLETTATIELFSNLCYFYLANSEMPNEWRTLLGAARAPPYPAGSQSVDS